MTKYEAGRRAEWKAMQQLREMGFIPLRTAGSHGFVDVIGIDPVRREIRLIQCKVTSGSGSGFVSELDTLAKSAPPGKYKVSSWLYVWKRGGRQWLRQEMAQEVSD